MKHVVTLTTSNPSHEHVSLRRRQSTTNFMVEAADEDQAIFRATAHFRKLGYYIHEAKIDKKKSLIENPVLSIASRVIPAAGSAAARSAGTAKRIIDKLRTPAAASAAEIGATSAGRTGLLSKVGKVARTYTIANLLTPSISPQQSIDRETGTLGQWRGLRPLSQPFGARGVEMLKANVDEEILPQKRELKAIGRVINKRRHEDKKKSEGNVNKINMEPKLVSTSMPGATR